MDVMPDHKNALSMRAVSTSREGQIAGFSTGPAECADSSTVHALTNTRAHAMRAKLTPARGSDAGVREFLCIGLPPDHRTSDS